MDSLGQILTFYSYKGGVGRSMGLANVATLLAKWKRKVLVIDWDLEAPGIEGYFEKQTDLSTVRLNTPGVVDLIESVKSNETLDWRRCLMSVKIRTDASSVFDSEVKLISAGKSDEHYIHRMQHINWEDLFNSHDLGHRLEELRIAWKEEFDYILIDSRTGITDIGGVCTIHLPDVLVIWFTTNKTNVQGAKYVAEQAKIAHDQLPFDRNPLLVLPVPSRDESRTEVERATEWQKRFADTFGGFYKEWLPKEIQPAEAVEILRVPNIPYWSFEEGLPVLEEDPSGLSKSYQNLARLLFFKLDWQKIDEDPESSIEYLERAAEADINRYGPQLATTLFDRALVLWKEERREETIFASKRAVEIWETVGVENLKSELELARAKKFLSEILEGYDEQESTNQAKAAADCYLRLYTENPSRLREEVATSLMELSERTHNKEPDAAIETRTKAIELLRDLARTSSRFESELARGLRDLADWNIQEKRYGKALEPIRESVAVYRRLAEVNRARYQSELADALITLSECLLETGDLETALASGYEAVEIYKSLIVQNPKQYESGLAKTFNALLDILSRVETDIGPIGVISIEEAIAFFRKLAIQDPKQYEFELAKVLNMLPEALSKEDRLDEALRAQKEAIEILRRLAGRNPNRYWLDLGQSLLSLSKLLSKKGDASESRSAASEAVKVFEQLTKDAPSRYEDDLNEAMRLSQGN